MMKGKTVLITGATGLLGSNLAKECLNRGARVIALGRSEEKLKCCFDEYVGLPCFDYAVADVSETPLPITEPVDYIFHAASPIERTVIENQPLQVIKPNVSATEKLLYMMYRQKQTYGIQGRIVIFSSATIYGNPTNQNRLVSEQDTQLTEPLDHYNAPYSQSKRMAEVLACAYWRQYGVQAVIGRFSYVYGYSVCHPMTAFYEFMQKACCGEDIFINSARLARRDNIYVMDAVNGVLQIALKGQPGEAYNISSGAQGGNFAAVDEIAQVMKEQAKSSIRVIYHQPIEHLPGLILDNRKLSALGWTLQTDLKSGITATFQAIKDSETKK